MHAQASCGLSLWNTEPVQMRVFLQQGLGVVENENHCALFWVSLLGVYSQELSYKEKKKNSVVWTSSEFF